MDQTGPHHLVREKSFQIKPSGPLRQSSLDPDFLVVDLKLQQDPSEAEFVQKLSTLRRERKTLTRTLRLKEERERGETKKVFAASLAVPKRAEEDSQSDLSNNPETRQASSSFSSKEALLPLGPTASKALSKSHEVTYQEAEEARNLLRKKKSAAGPLELKAQASGDLQRHRKSKEIPTGTTAVTVGSTENHEAPGGEGVQVRKRKSTLGVPGELDAKNSMELTRLSTFSEDFDRDESHERIHRRRSRSNPAAANHSVKFELTEMDKMATGEYLSFDDLKRRQSVPGIPVHPHNYKQWLRKKQSDLRSEDEDDEIDPDVVLQPLADQGGGYDSGSDSELEPTPKDRSSSKDNTASSLSLSSTGLTAGEGGTPRKDQPKPSPLGSAKTATSSPVGESGFFGGGAKDKDKGRKKRKRLQPLTEHLYPWEHFGLQQAIMGANLFSLLAAFAILFGLSAWSVSQLGQQTSSFVGSSTLEFVSGNITGQFHLAQEVLLDLENTIVLSGWTLPGSKNFLEHTLAILLNKHTGQTVGSLFYSQSEGTYLEMSWLMATKTLQLGRASGGPLAFFSVSPSCAVTNSSCDMALSVLHSVLDFSTSSAPWNLTLEQATDLSQVLLTQLYRLPTEVYGMVLAKAHQDALSPGQTLFVTGATLEPLRLSATLLDLRNYLAEGSAETDLLIFVVDSVGYLVGVSLEDPSAYLFSQGGCQGGCRVAAVDCSLDGIGNVYLIYLQQRETSKEIVAGTYRGLVKTVSFGGKGFDVVVSIRDGAFVRRYQTIQYVVIAVTFFVILVVILLAIRFVTQRLTRSVNKVSKMMVDMANLDLTYTPTRESRRFHIKETERLVSAMEVMNVALRSFIKYVPQEVVKILVQENAEVIIGVDDSFLTIFFSDIEGFTTISELLEASDLIQVMSEYLEEMSQIILDSGGVVDKYIGDAIMAFWNAPLSVPSHRAVACAVALRMQRRLRKLNSDWSTRGIPAIKARIGINAGIALVGNLGSPQRMSYTCIGDCVNAASRLENLNKQYGTYVMISENVYQAKTVQESFLCRTLDKVCVKGKTQSLLVYELVCELKLATDDIKTQLKVFNEGFELYQKREFAAAARQFSRFLKFNPDDKAAEVLKQRCKSFVKNPPQQEWDGSFIALEK